MCYMLTRISHAPGLKVMLQVAYDGSIWMILIQTFSSAQPI